MKQQQQEAALLAMFRLLSHEQREFQLLKFKALVKIPSARKAQLSLVTAGTPTIH